jgi:hypothetical protein
VLAGFFKSKYVIFKNLSGITVLYQVKKKRKQDTAFACKMGRMENKSCPSCYFPLSLCPSAYLQPTRKWSCGLFFPGQKVSLSAVLTYVKMTPLDFIAIASHNKEKVLPKPIREYERAVGMPITDKAPRMPITRLVRITNPSATVKALKSLYCAVFSILFSFFPIVGLQSAKLKIIGIDIKNPLVELT